MADSDAKNGPKTANRVAVALRHDMVDLDSVPTVVASGRGHVAEKIIALALENGIKVREDPDLVELLAVLDVGAEIPVEAFAAVAEILAYVYRANGTLPSRTEP